MGHSIHNVDFSKPSPTRRHTRCLPSALYSVNRDSWAWTFFGGGAGVCGAACNDWGNFNIWKDTMAKLLLSLFKLIFFFMIYVWPEEWNLYHTLENYELYHRLSTLGVVTIQLAHEMRQNTDTWFTRTRQYFNTIFMLNFQWQNICLLITKCKKAVVFWNILTNLGL